MRIQLYRREEGYWTIRAFSSNNNVELTSIPLSFSIEEAYEKTSFDDDYPEEA